MTPGAWAQTNGRRWAFSDRNAGAVYANFFDELDDLDQINWDAVEATDFRDAEVKEGKQAEFLVHEWFPWELIEEIGVADAATLRRVEGVLARAAHKPLANVEPLWYY